MRFYTNRSQAEDPDKNRRRSETDDEATGMVFLGLTEFCLEFIPDYAGDAALLTNLTEKGARNEVDW